MNVFVCVKMVLSNIAMPNASGNDLFVLNPYDMYALNQIIQLRSKYDMSIKCICMGPLHAKIPFARCLAMGADEAVLINDNVFAGSDTYATSYILAEGIKKLGKYDLIICGAQAVDGETGQVVYGLAERLEIPCIADISQISIINSQSIILEKNVKDKSQTIELQLPALVSYNEFCSHILSVSLLKLKKAREMPIDEWTATDLNVDRTKCGLEGSRTQVLKTKKTLHQAHAVCLEGNSEELSEQLMLMLNKAW
jgi:electron transfer flavoprotein beta subunit